jgi:aquaporin TIP
MSHNPKLYQKLVAEIVGTFLFVFIGAGSAVATKSLGITDPASALVVAALANGLGLGIGISTTMAVSGGSLNPAVTIGLWVGRKISGRDVIPYILAELVGAIIASGLLVAVTPTSLGTAVHYGAPTIASSITVAQGLLFELVMTFFLVLVVYGTAVDERAPKIAGFGIGLLVLGDVLVGGAFTGAAMNPARAMGPMIAGVFLPSYWWVYWVGPIIGAILAALVYHYVLEKDAI